MRKIQLIEEIRVAFSDVKLSNGTTIHEALVLDNFGNTEEQLIARHKDTYTDWESIPRDLIKNYCPLIFMNTEGLKFHLPAYLILALTEDQTNESLMTILKVGEKRGEALFGSYKQKQLKSIKHFLSYIAASENYYSSVAIDALNKYWRKVA